MKYNTKMKNLFCFLLVLLFVGCGAPYEEFKSGDLVIMPITGTTGMVISTRFGRGYRVRHVVGTNVLAVDWFQQVELQKLQKLVEEEKQ